MIETEEGRYLDENERAGIFGLLETSVGVAMMSQDRAEEDDEEEKDEDGDDNAE